MEAHLQYLAAWDAAGRGIGEKRDDAMGLVAAYRVGDLQQQQDPEGEAAVHAFGMQEMAEASREHLDRVALLGPQEVSEAATRMHFALIRLRDEAMTQLSVFGYREVEEGALSHRDVLAAALDCRQSFLVAVRDALTKPPRA